MFKGVDQLVKLGLTMVMADGTAGCLPNLLLWIEIGCSWRQIENFQLGMCGKELLNGWTPVPGSAIPKQQDRLFGIGRHQAQQEKRRDIGIH
mgnify:CR=1 FL=1